MNGHYFFFTLMMVLLISLPVFLIWEWNKSREAPIKELLKNFWNKRKFVIFALIGVLISEIFIPLNTNHGLEFNPDREKLGIPTLKSDWEKDTYLSKKYETHWWKPEPRIGHFKKVIEYGIFNAKSETDYYYNENQKETFVFSKFDFGSKTFEYFIEKPNDTIISFTESGKLKLENPTIIVKIDKSEFEKYMIE